MKKLLKLLILAGIGVAVVRLVNIETDATRD
jgi:hypothetical protein